MTHYTDNITHFFLAKARGWITTEQYQKGFGKVDEISRMLWSVVDN